MTDTITIPRAVVRQALKPLERADKISGHANNKKVIKAIRSALVPPPPPPPPPPFLVQLNAEWERAWEALQKSDKELQGSRHD